jgi:hypothetical protein
MHSSVNDREMLLPTLSEVVQQIRGLTPLGERDEV